jgi:hypothetical protein
MAFGRLPPEGKGHSRFHVESDRDVVDCRIAAIAISAFWLRA